MGGASIVAERKFKNELLNFIDKTRKGYFHGSNDPSAQLQTLVTEVNWDDFDSIYSFCEEFLERLTQHKGRPISIKDQVIYVNLDKPNNYKFSYETGSIENSDINQRIVDVLEGSQPAFIKRRLKYQI